jgi:hypothetical protein
MAVPVVASSTTNSAGSTATLTMTKPSGVAAGDLLLVICGSEAGGTDGYDTAPSGWNLVNYASVGSSASVAAFWRIADGGEPSTTDFVQSLTRDSWGFYLRITGADETTPIHVVGSDYSGTGELHSITGVTTSTADCLAVVVGCAPNVGAYSFSISGWSGASTTSINSGGGTPCAGFRATKTQASAGATGTAFVDVSPDSFSLTGFQFAIAPGLETLEGTADIVGGEAPDVAGVGSPVITGSGAIIAGEAPDVSAGNAIAAIIGGEAPDVAGVGSPVVRGAGAIVAGECPDVFGGLLSEGAIDVGEAPDVAGVGSPVVRGAGAIVAGEAPDVVARGYRDAEVALLVDLDVLADPVYRVVARNLETGVETILGTATAADPALEDVAIADGKYMLRVEVDGRFWRGARYAREFPLEVLASEIVAPLPQATALAAAAIEGVVIVTWTHQFVAGEVPPADWAIWTGATSPVDTSGPPAATAVDFGPGGYLVELAAHPSVLHVAVAARADASTGPISEVAVSGAGAALAAPSAQSARNPDGGWAPA